MQMQSCKLAHGWAQATAEKPVPNAPKCARGRHLATQLASRSNRSPVHSSLRLRSWHSSAFYSCIPIWIHGPTCIFWANLTPFSLGRKFKPGAPLTWVEQVLSARGFKRVEWPSEQAIYTARRRRGRGRFKKRAQPGSFLGRNKNSASFRQCWVSLARDARS